jgi:mycobactin peptide synthetase MbtE
VTETAARRPSADAPPGGWVSGPSVDLGGPGIVERVVAQARRSPDAVAVRDAAGPLSYQRLEADSAGLAGELQAAGVRAGDIVALCLPRGARLVTAMLATLRTGAAYCALDPHWPAARRQQVADHIGAAALVADSAAVAGLALVAPDARAASLQPAQRGLDDGFAVYYTSGSSGTPKAALTTDRAVLRTVLHPPITYPAPPPHMLSTAALPWDVYTLETWYPLLHGGTTDQSVAGLVTPQAIRSAVRRGVSSAWLTASLFNLIVDEDIDAFRGLRSVLTGGERVSPRHARTFLDRHPQISLVNGYGPVEASVFVSTHRIRPGDCDDPAGIPIGRPLPNTGIAVVRTSSSAAVESVGIGETGEILIAGDGLAREYLGGTPGGFETVSVDGGAPCRVYRTGDLGTWAGDGILRYIGRADRQLKIRGQRVEPAELEQALIATGQVRRCAVVPVPSPRRPTGLAAYVVLARPDVDPADLAAAVRKQLPDVLVPRFVAAVDELPIGPTGKIDLSRLPVPGRAPEDALTGPAHAAAEDDVTARIVACAANLVATAVSVDTDLKRAGLDSLGAIRLSARLYEDGVQLAAEDVLRQPVPARLAELARPRVDLDEPAGAPRLSTTQEAFWLDDLIRPERAAANLVLLGYRFTPAIDPSVVRAALASVVARQGGLRTAISMDDDGGPSPIVLDTAAAADLADSTGEPGSVAAEGAARIDLANGPLLVGRTVRTGDATDLVLAVHHACFDGHSEAVLADELSAALSGRPVATPVPPLEIDERRNEPDPRWIERLSRTADIDWPTPPDTGSAPAPDTALGSLPCAISASVHNELVAQARRGGVTPFVPVLRALGRAVRGLTGQSRFCVGVPVHTGDIAALRRIGCHIHTAVVAFDDTDLDGPLTSLAQHWASARHHAPIGVTELARRAGRTGRERTSLYQVQLAWQNVPRPRWDVTGHRVEPIRLDPLMPQLEITVEFWPGSDDGADGQVEYDARAVNAVTAARLRERLGVELESVVADGTL